MTRPDLTFFSHFRIGGRFKFPIYARQCCQLFLHLFLVDQVGNTVTHRHSAVRHISKAPKGENAQNVSTIKTHEKFSPLTLKRGSNFRKLNSPK